MTDGGADGASASLAYRLEQLFATVHAPGGGRYTDAEVAAAISEMGRPVSSVYIWQLRTGRRVNPSMEYLQRLADFFDIEPAYFFDDRAAGDILRDLHALRAMRRLGVRGVAARLGPLAARNPEALGEILDNVVRAWEQRQTDDDASGESNHPFGEGSGGGEGADRPGKDVGR